MSERHSHVWHCPRCKQAVVAELIGRQIRFVWRGRRRRVCPWCGYALNRAYRAERRERDRGAVIAT